MMRKLDFPEEWPQQEFKWTYYVNTGDVILWPGWGHTEKGVYILETDVEVARYILAPKNGYQVWRFVGGNAPEEQWAPVNPTSPFYRS